MHEERGGGKEAGRAAAGGDEYGMQLCIAMIRSHPLYGANNIHMHANCARIITSDKIEAGVMAMLECTLSQQPREGDGRRICLEINDSDGVEWG